MNDLFSTSFSRHREDHHQSPSTAAAADLIRFFKDVDVIKDELRDLESLYSQLQAYHKRSKTLNEAAAVKSLRSRMDANVDAALTKAKSIKLLLEALDRSNAEDKAVPGCGPGTPSDRTRTSVVNGLRKKLHSEMDRFSELRREISAEYRETVQRRYFTVTGEGPDEEVLDRLIETGESELFLQKAIGEQGKGRVMDTILEIQERHDAVKEVERSLMELHQVFLDMAVLVENQGDHLEDIESQVKRASSFVRRGNQDLEVAKSLRKSSYKWVCIGILILLIVAAIVVLSIRPWERR